MCVAHGKTMILDNAVIDGQSREWGIVVREEGMTVKLIGENIIRAKNGILAECPFTIEGTEGSSLCIEAQERGIEARGDARISCGHIRIHAKGPAMAIGGCLSLGKTDLEIEAGTYAGIGVYAISCGRMEVFEASNLRVVARSNWPALYIGEKASVKNSAVDIRSAASAGISGKELEISHSVLKALGKGRGWPTMYLSGKVSIADSVGEIWSEASNGIYCKQLDILRSDLRIRTKEASGCCIYTWGDICVQGGTLKVEEGSLRSEGSIVIDGVVTNERADSR